MPETPEEQGKNATSMEIVGVSENASPENVSDIAVRHASHVASRRTGASNIPHPTLCGSRVGGEK
jgi:hypothetical protein